MTTLEIKLSLTDRLAKEAQQAGLLAPEELERLVLETNTAISGLLWHGIPGRPIDAAQAKSISLFPLRRAAAY